MSASAAAFAGSRHGGHAGGTGYEVEISALETEAGAIDLALRPDGRIDMVVSADGADVVLTGNPAHWRNSPVRSRRRRRLT